VHDLLGFGLLIVTFLVLVAVLIYFVLPLLMTWVFGTLAYVIALFFIVRHGRVHPDHLDSYLKPGLPWMVVILTIVAPTLHAAYLYFEGPADIWMWIAGFNTLIPLAMTGRTLIRHHRQKRRYIKEGHDVEDLISTIKAKISTVEVRLDLLSLVSTLHYEPESWEILAGLPEDSFDLKREEITKVEKSLSELATEFTNVLHGLDEGLTQIREGAQDRDQILAPLVQTIERLRAEYDSKMVTAQALITEVLPGVLGSEQFF
jgi:hypothetical protein